MCDCFVNRRESSAAWEGPEQKPGPGNHKPRYGQAGRKKKYLHWTEKETMESFLPLVKPHRDLVTAL